MYITVVDIPEGIVKAKLALPWRAFCPNPGPGSVLNRFPLKKKKIVHDLKL